MPATTETPDRLLANLRDASRMLGVSSSKFQRLVNAGEIRYVIVGGVRMYATQTLRDFVDQKLRQAQ